MIKKGFLFFCYTLLTILSYAQNKTLDYYLDQALINSPLLKDYRNQVQTNLLDSQRILAAYKPQVNGSSINYYAPTINGYGYDNAITNGAQASAIVGVNKQIVSKGNLNTQFQGIQIQNRTLDNTSKLTEQDIKRNVAAQYITTYSDLQQIQFNREIIDLLHKEEVLLKQLTEKNVYRQSDYLTFLVSLKQQELLLRQIQIQFRNNFATLNYLCGLSDTASSNLQDPGIHLNELPDQYNSAFFQQFMLDSLKLINNRDLIDFSYRPKLSLYADGGYQSSLAYKPYKNFGASAGVNLFVPIYDGHQRKLLYNKLAVDELTRTNYKDFFTRQYNQQQAQLRQQLHGTEELLTEIKNQITYSEGLIRVNAKLLETGDVTIPDYIIALNTYVNARFLLTQNNITRLQIINQINYWNR